jgi:hypothetical protein
VTGDEKLNEIDRNISRIFTVVPEGDSTADFLRQMKDVQNKLRQGRENTPPDQKTKPLLR